MKPAPACPEPPISQPGSQPPLEYHKFASYVCPRGDEKDKRKRRFVMTAQVGVAFYPDKRVEISTTGIPVVKLLQSETGDADWESLCAKDADVRARLTIETTINDMKQVENEEPIRKEVLWTPMIRIALSFKDKEGKKKELSYVFDLRTGKDDEHIEEAKEEHLKKCWDPLRTLLCREEEDLHMSPSRPTPLSQEQQHETDISFEVDCGRGRARL